MTKTKENNLINNYNQWDFIFTGFLYFMPRKGCLPGQKTFFGFPLRGYFILGR